MGWDLHDGLVATVGWDINARTLKECVRASKHFDWIEIYGIEAKW